MDRHPGRIYAAKDAGSDGHGFTDGYDAGCKFALTERDARGDRSDVDGEMDENTDA